MSIEPDGGGGKFETPAQRLSAPNYVDWHMIQDMELSQLTTPESGVLGSIGFTALGGAIGLGPSVLGIYGKFDPKLPEPVTQADIVTVALFVACAVGAVVCLIVFSMAKFRNIGLSDRIRKRQKFRLPADGSSAEPPRA